MTKVSVVIPVKDRIDLLQECLNSLVQQTHTNWEALVVDDHSEADVLGTVTSFGDARLQHHLSPGAGAPAARNFGAQRASGELLVFLDSDDLLAPHALRDRGGRLQEHPQAAIAISRCEVFRHAPGDIGMLFNADTPDDDLVRFLRLDIPWQTACATYRRSAWSTLGPWDESLTVGQDLDMACRALASGAAHVRTGRVDCYYRVGTSGIGSRDRHPSHQGSQIRRLLKLGRLLRSLERLSPQYSTLLAGNLLRCCWVQLNAGQRQQALQTWRLCANERWLPPALYRQVQLLLITARRPLLHVLMAPLMARWPSELFIVATQPGNVAPGAPTEPAPVLQLHDPGHPFRQYGLVIERGALRHLTRSLTRRISPP